MSYTIYESAIVASKHLLASLEMILTKAEAHIDAASFPSKRLAEDMFPFSFQIWSVCRLAEVQVLKLQEKEVVIQEYNGELATYPEMHARIKEVISLLDTVDKDEALKHTEEITTIDFGRRVGERKISATSFCVGACIPNIYFHTTIAYAILRNAGVELSKFDYLGPFFMANIGGT